MNLAPQDPADAPLLTSPHAVDNDGAESALAMFDALVARLRPVDDDPATARAALQALATELAADAETRTALRAALFDLLGKRRAVLLFASAGIYPDSGVFSETARRIAHRLLPEADDAGQARHALGRLFRRRDAGWLEALSPDDWAAFFAALRFDEPAGTGFAPLIDDLAEALRVVAHRIAANGLDAELLRLDPVLEKHESPFLAQCEEALQFARRAEAAIAAGTPLADNEHDNEQQVLVLIGQCRTAIERVRRRAQRIGATFHLTFRLRRLLQQLARAESLAGLAGALARGEREETLRRAAELWRWLVLAEVRRNDLRHFWRQNTELVALRVTENAGRAGDRYIGSTRAEYFAMLRSAALGGFVIALMAANKLLLHGFGLPPLTETLAYCLNYALGFVLIHVIHGTVATKQPAMTANAIAAAIEDAEDKGQQKNLDPLIELIARTVRTQLAAIAGNVMLAVPTAMLLAMAVHEVRGEHFIGAAESAALLQASHPLASGALFYAAIAGVCLFLAGLIAGYYDNLCAYNRIPERLLQLRWPGRLLGAARWRRSVAYVENNLGALAGNFFFGFLLGGAGALGMLFGLPIDIRHIAFSSAYWAYALVGLDLSADLALVALAGVGVLLIGLVNLAVSFYLALSVGLKARGVGFAQRRALGGQLLGRLLRDPRRFLLPPKRV